MFTEKNIRQTYNQNSDTIKERLEEFEDLYRSANDRRLYKELVFVILTSQSDAFDCWKAANELDQREFLCTDDEDRISKILQENDISYPDDKSSYLSSNYAKLSQPTLSNPKTDLKVRERLESASDPRNYLVSDLNGVGMKAASHFLRNTGFRFEIAILSSPTYTALQDLGFDVDSAENSDSSYKKDEKLFLRAAENLGLGPQEFDLSIWATKTGTIFK